MNYQETNKEAGLIEQDQDQLDGSRKSVIMGVINSLQSQTNSCTKIDLYEESMKPETPLRKAFPGWYYDDTEAAKRGRVEYCRHVLTIVRVSDVDQESDDNKTRGLFALNYRPGTPADYTKVTHIKTHDQLLIQCIENLRSSLMSALEVYERAAKYLEVREAFEPASVEIKAALVTGKKTIDWLRSKDKAEKISA